MDLHKAGILLAKINKLYETMRLSSDELTNVERDLMRDYVRRLYDVLLDEPTAVLDSDKGLELREVEVIRPEPKQISAQPEASRSIEQENKEVSRPTDGAASSDHTASPASIASESDEEVEVLFERPPARELAEKLQELPIEDLRRAMGINERIFTINELFGGDQRAFDETIARLNQFTSFEQAKTYLIEEIAVPFGWTRPDKKEVAKNFIKLVRRLYISK